MPKTGEESAVERGTRRGSCGVRRRRARAALALAALALGGCASRVYTVDDGRKVDEALLAQIRAFGDGERAIRPAILRSAALADPDCDHQWELPISVATSQGWSDDDRVAWVRALGVDERLTVVAAVADSPLATGERILQVGGRASHEDAELTSSLLAQARDGGQPFVITTGEGRIVTLTPFEVCRGHTRFVPPNTPTLQDYHWLLSLHPLQVAQPALSDDEALWIVLWGQGLSEEGGLRMKAFDYGRRIVGTLYNLATIASGLKGAALAADAAMKAAQTAAAKVATDLLRSQLIEQAKNFAAQKLRETIADSAERVARAQLVDVMSRAARNRGALSGVARVASTVFDRADAWALARMDKLSANPLAGFTLHQKMVDQSLAENAFALDTERLEALTQLAEARGLGEQVTAILRGVQVREMVLAMSRMPLASSRRGFRYDTGLEADTGPYSNGLIDAMTAMPIGSGARQ
jgi:hypothetical protein